MTATDISGRPLGPSRHLLRRAASPGPDGLLVELTAADAGWEYVSFAAWRLAPGQGVSRPADDQERLVLVLEGHATVVAGDENYGTIGSRVTVFDGPPPPVVLIAPGVAADVTAISDVLLVIGGAPGGPLARGALVEPSDILVESRGLGNTARRIHHLLPPGAEAGRLISFEVFTPGGNWSSYPPHKHDTEAPPTEASLEELYFYRFAKSEGFAFQRVYSTDRSLDEVLTPTDLDVVLVPEGYHMVGVPAGYDCYYLNIMAGPHRDWYFTIDPDHAWLMNWSPAVPQVKEEETSD